MKKPNATDKRDLFIYQVYVRNHTEAGTFQALINDLDRIRALGVDMIYLLPVNLIGAKNRKGTLGSPYAIKDYKTINPELGTYDDFKALINACHERKMKVMLDIVFNHTSPDATLLETNPEFYYKENGAFKNRIGDWWDVTDFDFSKSEALWETLIDVLVHYTNLGVDGYRFDVASLLPLAFLEAARQTIDAINPQTIWLSESVHGHFLKEVRDRGFEAHSEAELFTVFDMAYDYDAHPYFEAYLKNEAPLAPYVAWLQKQEEIYPKDYVKLRNLENHDFGRIAAMVHENKNKLKQWHAFNFFNKGATMIFSGSETFNPHHPDLFNKDTIDFNREDHSAFFKRLNQITRGSLFTAGIYHIAKADDKDVIIGRYENAVSQVTGIFNVALETGTITIDLPDGRYENAIDGTEVTIKNNRLVLKQDPVILFADPR